MPLTTIQEDLGDRIRLRIDGSIDDKARFPAHDSLAGRHIEIDFEAVLGVNSIGIRTWVDWINGFSAFAGRGATTFTFARVPEKVISQLNMIKGFAPAGTKVTSVYVPYYCKKCEKEQTFLAHIDAVVLGGVPVALEEEQGWRKGCGEPTCALEMEYTAEQYFAFARRR